MLAPGPRFCHTSEFYDSFSDTEWDFELKNNSWFQNTIHGRISRVLLPVDIGSKQRQKCGKVIIARLIVWGLAGASIFKWHCSYLHSTTSLLSNGSNVSVRPLDHQELFFTQNLTQHPQMNHRTHWYGGILAQSRASGGNLLFSTVLRKN